MATIAATAGFSAAITAGVAARSGAPEAPARSAATASSNGDAANGALNKIDLESPELAWWRESMKNHDQRIQWWRDARFGMFIHWGVYSTLGGTWNGQPLQGYSEHIMRRLKIPRETYKTDVAGKFNPVNSMPRSGPSSRGKRAWATW
jgi:hypothetical protein